jgi:hypothetical protein
VAAFLLLGGHATFAAERAIGVIEEVARRDIDRDVVMEWEVLTPLEGLETVDSNLIKIGNTLELTCLQEQAMSAEPSDLVPDSGRTTR